MPNSRARGWLRSSFGAARSTAAASVKHIHVNTAFALRPLFCSSLRQGKAG